MLGGSSSMVPWWWIWLMLGATLQSQVATGQPSNPRALLVAMLSRVKMRTGFEANAIVDVGANLGDWSREARKLFPNAKLLMLEATPKHDESLRKAAQEIGNAQHKIAVVSSRNGETVQFFQDGNTGNSMFRENTNHYVNHKPAERTTSTVDSIIAASFLKNEVIDVIKADVQGAELAVFQGASKALSQASFVYFEASTIEYNAGAPCSYEVDAYLRSKGFFLYDISGIHYNDAFKTFGAGQYDVMYIRPDSPRLPKVMLESGAKYCGMGKSGHHSIKGLESVDDDATPTCKVFLSWVSGLICGILITRFATRLVRPTIKRQQ